MPPYYDNGAQAVRFAENKFRHFYWGGMRDILDSYSKSNDRHLSFYHKKIMVQLNYSVYIFSDI